MSDGVVIIRRKRADILENEAKRVAAATANATATPHPPVTPVSRFHFDEGFLNEARKEGKIIEITLLDGTSYKGLINSFDSNTVYFLDPQLPNPILLYKQSIRQMK